MRPVNSLIQFLFFLLLGICLTILWPHPVPATEINPSALNQQGFAALHQGNPQQAIQLWRQAETEYRKQGQLEGTLGTQVNQSLALQSLGLYPQACKILIQALKMEEVICQNTRILNSDREHLKATLSTFSLTPAQIAGLGSLGTVLRVLGHFEEAQIVLQTALKEQSYSFRPQLLLALANLERAWYLQEKDRVERTDNPEVRITLQSELQSRAQRTLALYQEVASNSTDSTSAFFAQVNRFGMLIQENDRIRLATALKGIESLSFAQVPPIPAIYGRLKISEGFRLLGQLDVAERYTQEALKSAQSLQNLRAQSYALGEIAKLLVERGQPKSALATFGQAVALAQSIHAWEAAYQWQRAIGQLYQQQRNFGKAEQAYAAAIHALDQVRGNILSANPEVQLSFQEQVQPVYREYLSLLLASASRAGDSKALISQPNLRQAVQIIQKLQQVELENYLQCGNLDLVGLDQIRLPSNTAVVYSLTLEDEIAVILQDDRNQFHYYSANVQRVSNSAANLIANLQNDEFAALEEVAFLPYAQALYQELIAPVQRLLPKSGTLVFVNDSLLQTIPLGILHDGSQYLVERYSIATALGSQLRSPQPLPSGPLTTLIAGLSETAPSFQLPQVPRDVRSLPEVEQEVQSLKQETHSTILLNQTFTAANFQRTLANTNFPVVHLTTHGQFSSSPEETFILSWDQAIDVQQIYQLIKRRTEADASIELLVLSACETAKGDRRSALGIAGLATQAGARSTVASLWRVDATSTATFMAQFYQSLAQGKTKADALRSAQLNLLAQPDFHHPYFWAPFILVGSWL